MKFVTSFGFRAGLVVASHLFGLVVFIASGQWTALTWLIIASLWAFLAFRWEIQSERWESIANRWRKVYEEEAFGVSRK